MIDPPPVLDQIIRSQHRSQPVGIPSLCSSHPSVIQAAFRHALKTGHPVLIESTCNQVNQLGGYSGMTPVDFVAFTCKLAAEEGFPLEGLLLGGDHLGPFPWQHETPEQAMSKAADLVQAYVRAGYTKIHLDASMPLLGEDPAQPLPPPLAAQRTAQLARAAEEAWSQMESTIPLRYVIGTEVPIPGGIQQHSGALGITSAVDVQETIQLTRQSFHRLGIPFTWQRVIAVVVHPGVEFGSDLIYPYDSTAARELSLFIKSQPNLVYEAHSTDYQTVSALKQMVKDHFAILKVGPALTFALREMLFALEMIEREWLSHQPGIQLSNLSQVVEESMLENPAYWQKYYPGEAASQRFDRRYSFSDRIRYYWADRRIQSAIHLLFANLATRPIPLPLLSQFLPVQFQSIRSGSLSPQPHELVLDGIETVLEGYTQACYPT